MDSDAYNGWANRETWLVALHLSNDQGTDTLAREWATEAYESWTPPAEVAAIYEDAALDSAARDNNAADAVRSLVEELLDNFGEGLPGAGSPAGLLLQDIVGTFVARVDWVAVASSFLPEVES